MNTMLPSILLEPDGTAPPDGSAVMVSASAPAPPGVVVNNPNINIEQSINLSGGDVEVPIPENSEPRENAETTDSLAHKSTRELVNHYRHNTSTTNLEPSNETYMIKLCEEIKHHATPPCHLHVHNSSKNHKNYTKCKCLHILRGESQRWAVGQYFLGHYKKSKFERDSLVVEWYKAATKGGTARNQSQYSLPFDASECPELSKADVKELINHSICRNGMMLLLDVGSDYLTTIKRWAETTGVAKKHGNSRKKNRSYKGESQVMKDLTSFFTELEKMGETRATRTVEEMVGGEVVGHGNRDNDENNVFLPITFGYRPCFSRYMEGIGWKVIGQDNGNYTVERIDETVPELKYVSLSAFYRIWHRDYPHIKVSRPIEDICDQCFIFSQRYKFLSSRKRKYDDADVADPDNDSPSSLGINSTLDATLFCKEVETETTEPECLGFEPDASDDTPSTTEKPTADAESTPANQPTPGKPADQPSPEEPTAETQNGVLTEEDLVDEETVEREEMLLRAALHVRMAKKQRELYRSVVAKAVDHAKQNIPHKDRSYTFVVDYGQNMELPVFNKQQPGCTYYYSPLSIYNLGVVNHAYQYDKDTFKEHMHAHVYHEGVGKKGANNVTSLIDKTLRSSNILREDSMGGELNIVFDNCSGQNKNNTVLKYMVHLTELGYFKKVNFIFLIVGHTKNAADRLFNTLKKLYRLTNIFTMKDLLAKLSASNMITIHPTKVEDFHDWDTYLDLFYSDFRSKIKQNHIFSCSYESNRVGNQLQVDLRESDLEEHTIVEHNTFKQGFFGRSKHPKGTAGLQQAIASRPATMKGLKDEYLKQLESFGINIFKRVELYKNYRPVVEVEFQDDELYQKPPEALMEAVKDERVKRTVFHAELKSKKQRVARIQVLKEKLDASVKMGELV